MILSYVWGTTLLSLLLSFVGQYVSLRAYMSDKSRFEDYYVFMAAVLYTAFFSVKVVDLLIPANLMVIRLPLITLSVWYLMLFVTKQFRFKTKVRERWTNIISALSMVSFIFVLLIFIVFPQLSSTRLVQTSLQEKFFSSMRAVDHVCLAAQSIFFTVSLIFCIIMKKDLMKIAFAMLLVDALLQGVHLVLFDGNSIFFSSINSIISISAQLLIILAMIDFYRARSSKRSAS